MADAEPPTDKSPSLEQARRETGRGSPGSPRAWAVGRREGGAKRAPQSTHYHETDPTRSGAHSGALRSGWAPRSGANPLRSAEGRSGSWSDGAPAPEAAPRAARRGGALAPAGGCAPDMRMLRGQLGALTRSGAVALRRGALLLSSGGRLHPPPGQRAFRALGAPEPCNRSGCVNAPGAPRPLQLRRSRQRSCSGAPLSALQSRGRGLWGGRFCVRVAW